MSPASGTDHTQLREAPYRNPGFGLLVLRETDPRQPQRRTLLRPPERSLSVTSVAITLPYISLRSPHGSRGPGTYALGHPCAPSTAGSQPPARFPRQYRRDSAQVVEDDDLTDATTQVCEARDPHTRDTWPHSPARACLSVFPSGADYLGPHARHPSCACLSLFGPRRGKERDGPTEKDTAQHEVFILFLL